MLEKINDIREKAQNKLNSIESVEKLPEWYHHYLGRKGQITTFLKKLGNVSAGERPVLGRVINDIKEELQDSFEFRQKILLDNKLEKELENDNLDVTLPGRPCVNGNLHLTSKTLRRIFQIFQDQENNIKKD